MLTVAKPSVQTVIVDVRMLRKKNQIFKPRYIQTLLHKGVRIINQPILPNFTFSVRTLNPLYFWRSNPKYIFYIFHFSIQTPNPLYFLRSNPKCIFFIFFLVCFEAFGVQFSRCSLNVTLFNFVRSFQRRIFYSIVSYSWKIL